MKNSSAVSLRIFLNSHACKGQKEREGGRERGREDIRKNLRGGGGNADYRGMVQHSHCQEHVEP